MTFLAELHRRNPLFFYVSLVFLALFTLFLTGYITCEYALFEICHWVKPGKFTFSFAIYAMTLGWLMEYLKEVLSRSKIKFLTWAITLLISAEMVVILLQSGLGSQATQLQALLYPLGNLIILINTLMVAYIGLQFFRPLTLKPIVYLWGIRMGFVIFMLSSVLGGFLVHKYGQVPPDPEHLGIPFTLFSTKRDLLISLHFLGIHYLQLLPFCCYYFQNQISQSFVFYSSGLYLIICLLVVAY
jgi:hypothetical protein